MSTTIIRNARIVNEGRTFEGDVLIKGQRIERVGGEIATHGAVKEIDANGKLLVPGAIDDQVHFREPGLTHKGEIYTEARAAVAGGITSFMEMPNTVPQAITQKLLEEKYQRASECSLGNYSFFMGTTNNNLEEVLKTNAENVCGIKIFMGSSTGDMLVDDARILESVFSRSPLLIATHCEDEQMIKANLEAARATYGDLVPPSQHPIIRNDEACFKSSSFAVELAKKHGTRLHVLHISSAKETHLFDNNIPLEKKMITAEACIHHLWFTDKDYLSKGNWIKWNPAVKKESDRDEIRKAVVDGRIDVIATDHAPHTFEEKQQKYFAAPSGLPLVQHSFDLMYKGVLEGWITIEKVIDKMCHAPSICYNVKDRGFIREGYFADFFLFNPNIIWEINKGNIFYKCNWSPLEGQKLNGRVEKTFVNGNLTYSLNHGFGDFNGMRLNFNKK